MKKISALFLLMLFSICLVCEARITYDSTGRNIVEDDTIRGRRQASEVKTARERRLHAAAAAKMDYEAALRSLEEQKPRSNFYQDQIKYRNAQ